MLGLLYLHASLGTACQQMPFEGKDEKLVPVHLIILLAHMLCGQWDYSRLFCSVLCLIQNPGNELPYPGMCHFLPGCTILEEKKADRLAETLNVSFSFCSDADKSRSLTFPWAKFNGAHVPSLLTGGRRVSPNATSGGQHPLTGKSMQEPL